MQIVIIFSLFGFVLLMKRLIQFYKYYKTLHIRRKEKEPLFRVHSNAVILLSPTLILLSSIVILIKNIENPVIAGLLTMMIFICIGEIINAIALFTFYYDEKGFYYYHTYVQYKEVKQMQKEKGFLGLTTIYSVQTKSGYSFSISGQTYLILQSKLK